VLRGAPEAAALALGLREAAALPVAQDLAEPVAAQAVLLVAVEPVAAVVDSSP
jgi:hypothetical protein